MTERMKKIIVHKNKWKECSERVVVLRGGIGLVTINVYDENPAVAYCSNLQVLAKYRNRGIGNELIEAAKQNAREMGAATMCVWAYAEKWHVEWYKRHGFKEQMRDTRGAVGLSIDL